MPRKKKAPKKVYIVFDTETGDVLGMHFSKGDAKEDAKAEDNGVVVAYEQEGGK